MKQRRGKDVDFQPKTNLHRGKGFRHILCGGSHLYITVIAGEQQSKARLF